MVGGGEGFDDDASLFISFFSTRRVPSLSLLCFSLPLPSRTLDAPQTETNSREHDSPQKDRAESLELKREGERGGRYEREKGGNDERGTEGEIFFEAFRLLFGFRQKRAVAARPKKEQLSRHPRPRRLPRSPRS